MSNYEYHQFLKFLYFEGYADSYEEAEYLLEELNDEELENLIEQSGITDTNRRTRDRLIRQYGSEFFTNPRPTGKKKKVTSVKSIELTNQEPKKRRTTDMSRVIVAHYLFGEGYAETLDGAEVMAENISETWIHLILSESDIEPPKERLVTDRNMFNISQKEMDVARERTLAKAKAAREKKAKK